MEQISFTGNLVSKAEEILLNQIGAIKISEDSNYVDVASFLYEFEGKKIEVILEEELLDDITIISCDDKSLLESIQKRIG